MCHTTLDWIARINDAPATDEARGMLMPVASNTGASPRVVG